MNPACISVWMWNLPFNASTLMVQVAAIVVMATSLMRTVAYVARCEVARFLGTAMVKDFEGPADAILHSIDTPTMRGECGRQLSAVIGETWVTLRRFFDKPLGGVTQ
jgi:hypothetical protein